MMDACARLTACAKTLITHADSEKNQLVHALYLLSRMTAYVSCCYIFPNRMHLAINLCFFLHKVNWFLCRGTLLLAYKIKRNYITLNALHIYVFLS